MSEPEQHSQEPGLGDSQALPPHSDTPAAPTEDVPMITMGIEAASVSQEARRETQAEKGRIKDLLQRQRKRKSEEENGVRQLEMPLETGEETPEEHPATGPAKRRKLKPKRMKAIPQKRLIKSRRHLDRARRRQMNYLQKRREQKKMRVFYGRIRSTFKFFFALMWGVLIWEAVHSSVWLLDAPRFTVIHQNRDHLLQADQLEPWIKAQVGQPVFAIDPGQLADQLKAEYDVIDHVAVRRLMFPARLEVLVQEKKPWAELYPELKLPPEKNPKPQDSAAGNKAPAQPATVIPPKPYALLSSRPELVGLDNYRFTPQTYKQEKLTRLLVTPGKPLSKSFLAELEPLAYQLQHIPGLHFQWLDVRNPNVVSAQFDEVEVIIGRLDVEAQQRLARLVPLLPKIQEFRDVIDAVDLRWSQQVTFRKKPNAVIQPPGEEEIDG